MTLGGCCTAAFMQMTCVTSGTAPQKGTTPAETRKPLAYLTSPHTSQEVFNKMKITGLKKNHIKIEFIQTLPPPRRNN